MLIAQTNIIKIVQESVTDVMDYVKLVQESIIVSPVIRGMLMMGSATVSVLLELMLTQKLKNVRPVNHHVWSVLDLLLTVNVANLTIMLIKDHVNNIARKELISLDNYAKLVNFLVSTVLINLSVINASEVICFI